MFSRETLKWFARGFLLTSLILLAVAMAVWPPVGWAQGGGEEDPGAAEIEAADEIGAQTYGSPLVIPAADFSSDGVDPDGFLLLFSDGYIRGSATLPCVKAPAYLPHGVTVSQVCYTVYDNDASNFSVLLRRKYNFSLASADTMASLATSWNDTIVHTDCDTTVANPDTNLNYAYYVTVCLNSTNHRLYSVRIYY